MQLHHRHPALLVHSGVVNHPMIVRREGGGCNPGWGRGANRGLHLPYRQLMMELAAGQTNDRQQAAACCLLSAVCKQDEISWMAKRR